MLYIQIWALTQHNLQSGILTKRHPNQSKLENWNFTCSKFRCDTFQKANYNGAYLSAGMCRLVLAFVVRNRVEAHLSSLRTWFDVHKETDDRPRLQKCCIGKNINHPLNCPSLIQNICFWRYIVGFITWCKWSFTMAQKWSRTSFNQTLQLHLIRLHFQVH